MSIDEIKELMSAMEHTGLAYLSYQEGETSLTLKAAKEKRIEFGSFPEKERKPIELEAEPEAANEIVIRSPLVGVYYESGTPEGEPFVKIGDTITQGQVMGIIEAMKLMNEIESDYSGSLKEILVKNGEMVEFNQPLFKIG
ncbi:MAG: acetyl-CoA carboxylase biotin carboxyl carrier protein [Lachnospiraceae bacterium]